MIDEFIRTSMQRASYEHKEGTASSYYWQEGCKVLPNRLSISRGSEMTSVERKGRNVGQRVAGQFLGKFKVSEESPLKRHKPYEVRTQIWQIPEYPLFIGYGTIGITGESGRVEGDTGDLIVLQSSDQWEHLTIFYFVGMGNLNDMPQVMRFLEKFHEGR